MKGISKKFKGPAVLGEILFILMVGSIILSGDKGNGKASAGTGQSNHLIREKSPYLLQHAYNPVDWYPWGETAFRKAREENKPIFLSIGYSTCHWCHVMEKESFSNPQIAKFMNEFFVSIKVDREERPDVDAIYMTAVTAMTGSGGWPLSVWLTPDLKPFFGGTYFPPDSRWGRPGFLQLLERIAGLWKERREDLLSSSDKLNQAIVEIMAADRQAGTPDETALVNGFKSYEESYDDSKGGFGGAPKFPLPVNHNFLMRYASRSGNKQAMEMSIQTLRKMSAGGIYDHIGGGFHRYSTDAEWHVPHFEKMLYDNSQIAVNYLEAYQATGEQEFAQVARETLDYVLRDMTHPQGGFYSAEDADSLPPELAGKVSDKGHEHRSEGAFYIWDKKEILDVAGEKSGEIFCFRYGVEPNGNVRSDPHGEFGNKNVLYLAHTLKETADRFKKSEKEVSQVLAGVKQKLFEARERRPHPHLDDKILVSWNGLMISAFSRAAQVFDDPKYLKAALSGARFIRKNLYDSGSKKLFRRWRDGESKVTGIADDYAFLTQGLLDLYESSFDMEWLYWALDLTEAQNDLFYDSENGGFYMTSEKHDKNLLVRTKESSDNVEPSASSVAVLNLLRLAQFTDDDRLRKSAEKTLSLFAVQMNQQPRSLSQMLVALNFWLSKPQQIIIAGDPQGPDTKEMLKAVHGRFIPVKIVMIADGAEGQKKFGQWLPFLKGVRPIDGKATAYVCVDYACKLPTHDVKTLVQILEGK